MSMKSSFWRQTLSISRYCSSTCIDAWLRTFHIPKHNVHQTILDSDMDWTWLHFQIHQTWRIALPWLHMICHLSRNQDDNRKPCHRIHMEGKLMGNTKTQCRWTLGNHRPEPPNWNQTKDCRGICAFCGMTRTMETCWSCPRQISPSKLPWTCLGQLDFGTDTQPQNAQM